MKSFRKMCRGEKGFTLIELLVVIIILGVLAAVVTLAVTRFIGKGVLESARAEEVTVVAAVESAMAEANSGTLIGNPSLAAWTGAVATSPFAQGTSENATVASMMRTHSLKAAYTFNANGDILDGDPSIAGGWGAKIYWSTRSAWNSTTPSAVTGGTWVKVP